MGKADKDYFLDEDLKLTTSDGKAAFVLIRKGQEISKEMADKYGIGKESKPAEAAAKPVEEKSATPEANKSAAPTENK